MTSVEQHLRNAAMLGHIQEVEALLRDNPEVDVNWKDDCPSLRF